MTGRMYVDVQDVLNHEMSRRTALGAALAGALGLSACGGGGGSFADNSTKPKATGTIKLGKANIPTPREETMVIGEGEFTNFDNFNGMIPNNVGLGSGFMTGCIEWMWYLNLTNGELIPGLCDKYEYNEANDELTIHFFKEARWSDGKPLTSKDLAFTLLLKRDNPALFGGGGDLKTYIKDVETPDDQTAVIKLTKPNPRLHYMFFCVICTGFEILPEHIWKGQDPSKFKDNPPVRSGPYKLKQTIPAQKMFVWEKRDDYWNKDKLDPKPKYLVFTSTNKQADAAALSFERAEFDNGSLDDAHAQNLRAKGYPNMVDALSFRDPCPRGFWLNCDPERGLIGKPEMHQVITKLLDREKIGTKVMPIEVPPAQWPWADYEGHKKWEDQALAEKYPQKYDPEGAAKILDEIAPKGPDGKRMYEGKPATIDIITPVAVTDPMHSVCDVLKNELVKQGIAATFRALSGSVHDQNIQTGRFDISGGWSCDVSVDPIQMFTNLQSSFAKPIGQDAAGKNAMRVKDPELDKLVVELQAIRPDDEAAVEPRNKLMELYFKYLPFVPMTQSVVSQYFNTTYWTGWAAGDDIYQVPCHWWGQFLFVLDKLESTGTKAP